MNKKYTTTLFAILIASLLSQEVYAQVTFSTPYSMFGIGNLYGNNNQCGMALGGSSVAFSSPYFINPLNPASYAAFDTNSFVLDAALNTRIGTLSTQQNSQKYTTGSISNINFGFPITRWWRASLGIMPYSGVGYEINQSKIEPGIGRIVNIYKGSGGLNKAYIGSSFSPIKNFSLGVNAVYYFGDINKENAATFPDSAGYFNTMNKYITRLYKLSPDFGLMYRKNLKSGNYIQAGLTFNPSIQFKTSSDHYIYNFRYKSVSNTDIQYDTIYSQTGFSSKVKIPMNIGAGIMLGNTNRWYALADIHYQKWSDFSYLEHNQGLKDNLSFSFGGQYRPSLIEVGKYWNRVYYRAGAHFTQGNLELNGKRINEFGISFGLGLPMRRTKSTINVAAEFGTTGTKTNGLIQDNYFKFTLGTALQERWFLKPRYN